MSDKSYFIGRIVDYSNEYGNQFTVCIDSPQSLSDGHDYAVGAFVGVLPVTTRTPDEGHEFVGRKVRLTVEVLDG